MRDENVTNNSGQDLYDLWNTNGKSVPEVMKFTQIYTNRDSDGDGVPDHLDNCIDIPLVSQTDVDGDGYGTACDCDDGDNSVTAGAIWYADSDGDLFGSSTDSVTACTQPAGYVANNDDCDDTDIHTYPGAPAIADGKDNNCDGEIDKVTQTIVFEAIGEIPDTILEITLVSSITSGLNIQYIVENGDVEINGQLLKIFGPGEVSITAYQPGDDYYLPADPVSQTFCVVPTKPTIIKTIQNEVIVLTSSSDTGNYWYLNHSLISGEYNKSIQADIEGIYQVEVTIDHCTSDISDPVEIEFTSLEGISYSEFNLFPNPTNGWITLEVPDGLQNSVLYITIIDLGGRYILNSYKVDILNSEVTLYVGQYSASHYNYIIQEKDTGKIYRGQFIIY